ncbi:MAG: TonB-dependent receptor [Blastocatellales bacterium]|nr:TonB-dependent receptor [Blastocatellales bacterium]
MIKNLIAAFSPLTFVLLILTLASAPAVAQTTSTITGRIQDQQGAFIPGVKLTSRHIETGLRRTVVSDNEGRFTFPEMRVGAYEIEAERTGFRPLIRQGIQLTLGETSVVNLTMEVSTVSEGEEIRAEAPLVNTQTPELSYLVSERAVRELPLNGRNYTDLALLQPGVVAYPHRDGGSVVAHGLGTSVNGQDPRSNVYLLDGTTQNDFTNGPAGSAASTVLGVEAIREFRVEANNYSAEFGRNSGGQINAISKSGTNSIHGSLYHFLRNDNLDARNFFDREPVGKPEFKRNQFGGSIGGPIREDRTFYFFNYESLIDRLGRTISSVVPDNNARQGILPNPAQPGQTIQVNVNPIIRPYLDEYPLPNGPNLGGGLASYLFRFNQTVDQHYLTGRIDHNFSGNHQFFGRYTFDDADQRLPTDYPQFPRNFRSRNQFFTAEYKQVLSDRMLQTFRLGFSRTRVGQDVEANTSQSLSPFVPGRGILGGIDIGGIPGRFGPQTSVNVKLTQNVTAFEYGLTRTQGKHLLKIGSLVEHYQDNMVNPTFSLGIFTFANLSTFLQGTPLRFLGLTPEGAIDRYWRFNLFGFYAQDTYRVNSRLTLSGGLRYEFSTMPVDIYGRDSALINLTDATPTPGELYRNPTYRNFSPRAGFAWDIFGDGKTSVRGGYGVFFNTNNQQNLIVTVTNPPATPRISIVSSPTLQLSFPVPQFERGLGNTMRPVEWNIKNPYVQSWNLNLQRELPAGILVSLGYAGTRGVHLLRSGDVNIPTPVRQPDGTFIFPTNAAQLRPNPNFTTIELKRADGDSWYNALVFEVRKRFSQGVSFQSSYTFSRNIDNTQASTFFSDATNGTTSAFPALPGLDYNKGLADFHAKHNWVVNYTWELPFARGLRGAAGKILDGWQVLGIAQMRSGNPLTVFVQQNRSRSQWAPSLGPGLGFDRPNLAPGRTYENAVTGNPERWFDPTAFQLQPAGQLGSLGRGALIGPNLRTFDLSLLKSTQVRESVNVQFRVEMFNLFNRANFSNPSLLAFTGAPASVTEAPIASLGLIRATVTSARQIQFGLRIGF